MVTVYLHAGTEKTGTSAIQAFLNVNRTNLVKGHSCLYPNFSSERVDGSENYHNHCPHLVRNYRKFLEKTRDSVEYCRQQDIDKIIISCEGLWHYSKIAKDLTGIVSEYDNVNIRLIVYFRRQDDWYESSWKQKGHKIAGLSTAYDYANSHRLPWLSHLRQWSENIGHENIIVRVYEKEQLPDGLLSDFLSVAGIEYRQNAWNAPEKNNLNENPGLSRDILEILHLNKNFYLSERDHRLIRFFSDNLGNEYKKQPFEKYRMLSPRQRISILETYDEMNTTIAREYLGRKDGKLFYEPWPDPDEPWEPYEGLTVEKIVPVFVQMLYSVHCRQQRGIEEMRKKRSQNTLKNRTTRMKNRLWSFFFEGSQ